MEQQQDGMKKVFMALQAGQTGEAESLAEALLRAYPNQPELLHLAGVATRENGHGERAIKLMTEAIRLRPDDARIYANLALAHHALQQPWKAIAAMEQAISFHGDRPNDYVTLAAISQAVDPERAGKALTRLIELAKKALSPEQFIPPLKAALQLQPANVVLWRTLVRTQIKAGLMDDASRTMERALEQVPQSLRSEVEQWPADAMMWVALAQRDKGQIEKAAETMAQAMEIMPQRVPVMGGRGISLFELGRWQEAEPFLHQALAEGSPNAIVPEYLAQIAVKQSRDDQDSLLKLLEDLFLRQVGPLVSIVTAIADILVVQGRRDEALTWLNMIVVSNWSRFFTLKSLLLLENEAQAEGHPLSSPPPRTDDRPAVSATSLAYYGRFAHVLGEYLALRLYCETHGLRLEIPRWVGWAVFELDEPVPSEHRVQRRGLAPYLAATLTKGAAPISDVDIFSPGVFCDSRQRDRFSRWLTPRALWLPRLQAPLTALRQRGGTLIAMHLRRTDLAETNIDTFKQHLQWLEQHWQEFEAPLLYVATDDATGIRSALERFRPVMLGDLIEPWPNFEYLQDFHILRHADVILLSQQSSFGRVAALLNQNHPIVMLATPHGMTVVDFDAEGGV